MEKPSQRTPSSEVFFNIIDEQSMFYFVTQLSGYGSIISSILIFFVNLFLLKKYSQILGKLKLYLSLISPLFIIILTYAIPIDLFQDPLQYYVLFSIILLIQSIFYALPFFIISKSIKKYAGLEDYIRKPVLLIAFGLIILGLATSTPLEQSTFPPYGIFANSLLGIPGFVIMLGFINIAYHLSALLT